MEFLNNVLIVGGGAREHALLKALLRSDRPMCLFAYPGNPGMEADGCMLVQEPIDGWDDLATWAVTNEIELVVVGPEIPLVEGIVDLFSKRGLTAFGPSAKAARIEGSKAFAKRLMRDHKIPTATYETFTDHTSAVAHVRKVGAPLVVKTSGLAAGKGAIVCNTNEEALEALSRIFDKKEFGAAGDTVVVEEKMVGEEASVFVVTDGKSYKILPVSQDHKPIGDNDTGPNTGGMGAYAPAPLVDKAMLQRIEDEIVKPTLVAMRGEGCAYRGLLYVGIMATSEGPKVVEYNCRFGDPETQAVLPLVQCDWYELFKACAEGGVEKISWEVSKGACVTVVLASEGYPGKYAKGKPIEGIEAAEDIEGVDVYHAGTTMNDEGELVTNGGRVLSVSARGDSLEDAVAKAYKAVERISFDGKYCRTDIGAKGIAREREEAGRK
jgi:phosphoribosylamine--glycine ligase